MIINLSEHEADWLKNNAAMKKARTKRRFE